MTDRRRAIVLVTTSFPISGDGSEAAGGFVADLAEALSAHVPVRVVAPGERNSRETWCADVEVFRFAAPERPLSTLKLWRLTDLSAIRSVLAAGKTATQDAVRAGPTGHVLALWALPSGHWARRVSRETGTPYSVWTLGSDIWSLGRIPLVKNYIAHVLRDATHCYSDGLKLADDTRRICGREVMFLPSTRRLERKQGRLKRDHPPYRLLFLGRWHPNKGVDLLMEALSILPNETWTSIAGIDICGGGSLEPEVRAAAEQLVAQGRPVRVRGYLNKREAVEAISAADYLMIPSRIESVPVVFSDAMQLGCPVLCSPVGDLPGLVLGGDPCGAVSEGVTAADFAKLIVEAVNMSPSEFKAGIRYMREKFDIDKVSLKINEMLT